MSQLSSEELIAERLKRLSELPSAFTSGIDKTTLEMSKAAAKALGKLEIIDGKITLSIKNLSKISTIMKAIEDSLFGDAYVESVKSLKEALGESFDLTTSYYKEEFGTEFASILKQEAPSGDLYEALFEKTIQEAQKRTMTLMYEDVVTQQIITPLRGIISDAVMSESSYADALKSVTSYIEGTPTLDPALTKYVNTQVYDSYSISDATYSTIINDSIGAEYYKYAGGEVPDTRHFCCQRHNHYFKKSEIEKWGNLSPWQGQRKGTNPQTIFLYRGGYNCKHQFIPISEGKYKRELEKDPSKGKYWQDCNQMK